MRQYERDSDKNSFTPFIKYQPELKKFFGCSEAALIFEKLEYWGLRSDPQKGFWKFLEPCDHPLYKVGDSWQEELEISRKVFRRAFSVFGIHYKSKSAYLDQTDPFQGKMYTSYYDRKTNRTYFLRNHPRVQEFLSSLWQGVKKVVSQARAKITSQGSYRRVPSGKSFTCASNISLQRSTSSQDLKSEEPQSLPSEPEMKEEKDKNIKIAQDMLKIWNKVTSDSQPLRSDLKASLPQALGTSFQGSMELWTDFCLSVASSKFLMGEAPYSKFKAYLAWLIKPETVQAIKDKHYSLGDREVTYSLTSPQSSEGFNAEEVQGTDAWKKICEQLCNRLGYGTFKSWFQDLKFLSEDTSHPVVQCSSRFKQAWIQSRYRLNLEQVIQQILPHVERVEIRG